MNNTAPIIHTNLLETIFAFSPSDKPRRTHRVPPGGKDSLSLADRCPNQETPVVKHKGRPTTPVGAIDHIVFSEKDSIPHSIYKHSPSKNHPKDTCRAYIQDPQRVPVPANRTERRQSKHVNDCMGSVLNHETKTVVTPSGRVPPGGYQTFTIG